MELNDPAIPENKKSATIETALKIAITRLTVLPRALDTTSFEVSDSQSSPQFNTLSTLAETYKMDIKDVAPLIAKVVRMKRQTLPHEIRGIESDRTASDTVAARIEHVMGQIQSVELMRTMMKNKYNREILLSEEDKDAIDRYWKEITLMANYPLNANAQELIQKSNAQDKKKIA